MSERSSGAWWFAVGLCSFVVAFASGYQPGTKRPVLPAGSGNELSIGEKAEPMPLGEADLANYAGDHVFSLPFYKRLQSMNEEEVFDLAVRLKSSATTPRALAYDQRLHTLVRRLSELSPETTMAFCRSIGDETTRLQALTTAGEMLGMNAPDRALAVLPELTEDRIAFLEGLVLGVPGNPSPAIIRFLEKEHPGMAAKLRGRVDAEGPSLLYLALTNLHEASRAIDAMDDDKARQKTFDETLPKVGAMDLARAVDWIVAHRNVEWSSLPVVGAFRLEPRKTLHELMRLPGVETRDRLISRLLVAPTGIDATLAREVADSIGDESRRREAVLVFINRLADARPSFPGNEEAAFALAREYGVHESFQESFSSQRLYRRMRDEPIEALKGLVDRFGEKPSETRRSSVARALQMMRHSDVGIDGMESEILELVMPVFPAEPCNELANFLASWTDREPELATAAVSTDERLDAYKNEVWARASHRQPIRTIDAVLAIGGGGSAARVAINGGVKTLAAKDTATALEVFQSILDDPTRADHISRGTVESLAMALHRDLSLGEVWAWTESLPENLGEHAARTFVKQGAAKDFAGIRSLLEELPSERLRDVATIQLARDIAPADPAQAFQLALGLPGSRDQEHLMSKILKTWRTLDSEAALSAARVAEMK